MTLDKNQDRRKKQKSEKVGLDKKKRISTIKRRKSENKHEEKKVRMKVMKEIE